MREILFRGKMENGAWICGTYFPPANTIILHKNTPDENGVDTYKDFSVIPETVGQFTGFTDKNGKKIFEGDIVKGLFLFYRAILGVVDFQGGAFGLAWKRGNIDEFNPFPCMCNVDYEVIGNIHDNPELLEGV